MSRDALEVVIDLLILILLLLFAAVIGMGMAFIGIVILELIL